MVLRLFFTLIFLFSAFFYLFLYFFFTSLQWLKFVKYPFSYPNDGRKLKKFVQWLVQSGKVACAQVTNYVHSYYMREGKFTKTNEKLVVCKLALENKDIVLEMIKKQRPYKVPEILCEVVDCNEEYAKWMEESVVMKKK
jgi:uncharacterized protein involved in tolerance to divalent cations